jgi:hypothetical protein
MVCGGVTRVVLFTHMTHQALCSGVARAIRKITLHFVKLWRDVTAAVASTSSVKHHRSLCTCSGACRHQGVSAGPLFTRPLLARLASFANSASSPALTLSGALPSDSVTQPSAQLVTHSTTKSRIRH